VQPGHPLSQPCPHRGASLAYFTLRRLDQDARRRWVRLRRGVYCERLPLDFCASDPVRRHALDLAAAILVIGEDAHASHESACLHRLVTLAPQGQQVCLTRSRLSGGTGGRLTVAMCTPAELPDRTAPVAMRSR
jgi:hypothetical protein